jgi:hypothetical protein
MTAANGTYATRDQILSSDDLGYEDLVVPEWGGAMVRIRELTGTERGIFEKSISKVSNNPDGTTNVELEAQNLRVQLCALTMVNGEGERLFDDHEVHRLGGKSAKALQRVFDVASKLSGIASDSVEDAVGESEAIPSEELSSPSV